jgi:hypothetical protein
MKLLALLILPFVTIAGCARPADDLVFLTRAGCVQTDQMRANLDAALTKMHWPGAYQVVSLGTLSPEDARLGYPTPTLLYQGRDVYGMPTPTPPFPEPT